MLACRFDVYDADAFAPARFFLPKRMDINYTAVDAFALNGPCADVCVNSIPPPPAPSPPPPSPLSAEYVEYYNGTTTIYEYNVSSDIAGAYEGIPTYSDCDACLTAFRNDPVRMGVPSNSDLPLPGEPDRWMLPMLIDPSTAGLPASQQQSLGLVQVSNMMSDVAYAQNIFVAYIFIQSINMLMFMLRLVSSCAQGVNRSWSATTESHMRRSHKLGSNRAWLCWQRH